MTAAVAVVVFPIVGVIRGNMTVLVTLLIDDHSGRTLAHVLIECVCLARRYQRAL